MGRFNLAVPQGSCLSPILFNIYFNEVADCTNTLAYADDTATLQTETTLKKLQYHLQKNIKEIDYECDKIGLKISKSKSKILARGPKSSELEVSINNNRIELAESFKYLVVINDKQINFKEHIDKVKTQARTKFNLMRWLTSRTTGANILALVRVYKSFIRPLLEYASPVWMNSAKTKFKQTQQSTAVLPLLVLGYATMDLKRTSEHSERRITS